LRPRICVTILSKNLRQLLKLISKAEKEHPDMIEIRLDALIGDYDIDKIRSATEIPLIATNRKIEEGGMSQQEEDERIKTLIEASRAGFDFIDLELKTQNLEWAIEEIEKNGSKSIISFHEMSKTPSENEMGDILNKEKSYGAYICKIVGMAKAFEDNLKYLNFVSKNRSERLICFGMGEAGIVSRVLSPIFGAYLTFASIPGGGKGALGQISISEIKSIYRGLKI